MPNSPPSTLARSSGTWPMKPSSGCSRQRRWCTLFVNLLYNNCQSFVKYCSVLSCTVYVDLLYCYCQSIVQFFWLAMVNYHEVDLKAAKRKVIVIILVTLIFYLFVYYDFRWVTGDSLNKACCRGKPSANFMTVQIPPQTNRGSKSGCQWLIGEPILGVYSENSRYPFRISFINDLNLFQILRCRWNQKELGSAQVLCKCGKYLKNRM